MNPHFFTAPFLLFFTFPVSSAFLFHIHPLQDELFLVFSHMEETVDVVRGALIHAGDLGELFFARFFHFIE